MSKQPYTIEDRVRLTIELEKKTLPERIAIERARNASDSKRLIEVMKKMSNNKIAMYENYLKGNGNLSTLEKQAMSGNYAWQLFQNKLPLDPKGVEDYFGITVDKKMSQGDVNLAYYSWKNNDTSLFRTIDKQFNLTGVKSPDGKTLLEAMLANKELNPLYSNDFNFNRKNDNGEDVLYLFLKSLLDRTTYSIYGYDQFDEFMTANSIYNFDLNRKITPSGGAFLHWFVDVLIFKTKDKLTQNKNMESQWGSTLTSHIQLSSKSEDKIYRAFGDVIADYINDFKVWIALNGNEFNKKVEDNNGLTAFEYYKQNKDKILPYFGTFGENQEKTKKVMKRILK